MSLSPIRWVRFARAHRWTQRHMSDYLDGDLQRSERERAERHLDECPECRELLSSLRGLVSRLGRMLVEPMRPVAATVLAGVRAGLERADDDDRSA